jgi:ribosomal protein L7/L12
MTVLLIVIAAAVIVCAVGAVRRQREGTSTREAISAAYREDWHGREPRDSSGESKPAEPTAQRAERLAARPTLEDVVVSPGASSSERVKAIKQLRRSYPGLSLREAKDLVDEAAGR